MLVNSALGTGLLNFPASYHRAGGILMGTVILVVSLDNFSLDKFRQLGPRDGITEPPGGLPCRGIQIRVRGQIFFWFWNKFMAASTKSQKVQYSFTFKA